MGIELLERLVAVQGLALTRHQLMADLQRLGGTPKAFVLGGLLLEACAKAQDLRGAHALLRHRQATFNLDGLEQERRFFERCASLPGAEPRVLGLCFVECAERAQQQGRAWRGLLQRAQALAAGDKPLRRHLARRLAVLEAAPRLEAPAPLRAWADEKRAPEPDFRACISIADTWLDRARKLRGPHAWLARARLHDRALAWYYRAYPLCSPLERPRLLRHMHRLEDAPDPRGSLGQVDFSRGGIDQMRILGAASQLEAGRLILQNLGPAARALLTTAYEEIRSVRVRGEILSPDNRNFRIAVGDFCAIFNWELEESCHFWVGEARSRRQGLLFKKGVQHDIRLRQIGSRIVVCCDGQEVFQALGKLRGTVCVYPAVRSRIAVASIHVDGQIDRFTKVTEPSGKCW